MELAVNGPQVFSIHVRVNLSGRNVGVTEHLLHGPEIRAPFEKMSRE
jgi:hypothetical protein